MPTEYSYQMWVDKHQPKSISDLVGNEDKIRLILEWLKDWDQTILLGQKKEVRPPKNGSWADAPKLNAKACLISGAPGIGKSATVEILAKMVGYSVKCINASDK